MKIGMIGCGKMAQALARGFVQSGVARADDITTSDIDTAACRRLAEELGTGIATSNTELVQTSEILFLAVKPQVMNAVLDEIRSTLTESYLVISIAAGISLTQLAERLGPRRRLVRVMPNTPCLVGAAASGLSPGEHATAADIELARKLMGSVGRVHVVAEPLLDAVTGLSGSGPAYVYLMIEALSDGGVKAGLPRAVATELAAQTVLGAARMVLETGEHPGVLKDMVTSPGGTTIAGLAVLEQRGVRSAFLDAVDAASRRAKELGQ